MANDYVYNSTYAFSENKVTGHIELEGLEAIPFDTKDLRENDKVYSGEMTLDQRMANARASGAAGSVSK